MHLISTFLDSGLVLHVCLVEITLNIHLGVCHLQGSWTNASKKQREKLLELIRRLAEDDKEGVMAHKVNLSSITLAVVFNSDTLSHLIYLIVHFYKFLLS